MNDKFKDYVNYILKVKGAKITLEKMKMNFYIHGYKYRSVAKVRMDFYNKKDIQKVAIEHVYYLSDIIIGDYGCNKYYHIDTITSEMNKRYKKRYHTRIYQDTRNYKKIFFKNSLEILKIIKI